MALNKHNLYYYENLYGTVAEFPSNSNQVIFYCPDCGKSKLYVYLDTNTSWCFRCGVYRSYVDIENTVTNVKDLKVRIEIGKEELKPISQVKDYYLLEEIKNLDKEKYKVYYEYLNKRGFDEYDININRLRFGNMENMQTAFRIFIPVYMDNILVYYQLRNIIGNMGRKYDNPLGAYMNKKTLVLFNYDRAKLSDSVIVTEGVFDAMTVGSSAIATFGKSISAEQIDLISKTWKDIIIALDPDAFELNIKIYKKFLSLGKKVKIFDLKNYKDINEAGKDYVLEHIFKLNDFNYKYTDMLKYKFRKIYREKISESNY